jgi:hypothetical protein
MHLKIDVNGKQVEATPVEFVCVNEPFVEYHLSDGNVVRVKFVMTRILATADRGTAGEPIYSFQWQAVAVVDEKPKNTAN